MASIGNVPVEDAKAFREVQVKNVKFATSAVTGSLKDSANADIKCDFRLQVDVDGVTYYLPLYDTVV